MGFFDWQAPDSDSVNFKEIGRQLPSGDPVSNAIAKGAHSLSGKTGIDSRPIENMVTPGAVATGQSETQQANNHGGGLPPGMHMEMGMPVADTGNNKMAPRPLPYDPSQPFGGNVSDMSNYLSGQRTKDIAGGMDFASDKFGRGNPQVAEIEDAQRKRAMGLNSDDLNAYRERSNSAINSQMATGLRQLRGAQATNGVRGGAAVGAAVPIVQNAVQAQGRAQNDINLADMGQRSKSLNDYQNTVSGERAGQLGTALGFAGLGSADRANAMQYGLGQGYLNAAKGGAVPMPAPAQSKPWYQF